MAKTSNLNIRVDDEIKKQAEQVCTQLGTSMSNAVNMFLCGMVRHNGFPFDLKLEIPNNETIESFIEGDKMLKDPNTKRFSSVEKLFEELNS